MAHRTGRFVLDLTALLPHTTGVDRYISQLLSGLQEIDRENLYRVYINKEDKLRFRDLPDNFQTISLRARSRCLRFLFQQFLLPAAARGWEADVIHSPSFFMPLMRGRHHHVLTIHDMTFFSLPHFHTPFRRSRAYRQLVAESIRSADTIITPSDSTKRNLHYWISGIDSSKVKVIPSGINRRFTPCPSHEVRETVEKLSLPPSYILNVGTIEPRKNIPLLIRSYRKLLEAGHRERHLVLAGRLGWYYTEVLSLIQSLRLEKQVHILGHVADRDLPSLYAGADLFVYPSVHEGFGFPPLEAMACGVPTISSRGSALEENLAGAAKLTPPGDVCALAEAMDNMLRNSDVREFYRQQGFLRAARFQPTRTAHQTLQCYQEGLKTGPGLRYA